MKYLVSIRKENFIMFKIQEILAGLLSLQAVDSHEWILVEVQSTEKDIDKYCGAFRKLSLCKYDGKNCIARVGILTGLVSFIFLLIATY